MVFRFGAFTLDTGTGILVGPSGPVSLRPQTFRLLEVLLTHAPDLVDRNQLLDEVWGRTALSPNVLPQAISELRQALGDPAQAPSYIETLHRRGYRFIAPVARPGRMNAPDARDPQRYRSSGTAARSRFAVIGGLAALAAAGVLISLWWHQAAERRWLEYEALPEIRHQLETDVVAAWRLTHRARQRFPKDPRLEQLWLDLTLPVDVSSDPAGATIAVGDYRNPSAERLVLGQTPLTQQRLPLGMMRLHVSLADHVALEIAPNLLPKPETFHLHAPEASPADMVFVPAGEVTYMLQRRSVPAFWIDRFEVTNEQFQRFVEDRGYQRPELWPDEVFISKEGPDRSGILEQFVDQTGLPGPSTWALGTFPEGRADHPVEGVSWYEATAYAAWAGKRLPNVFQWYRAAGLGSRQAANFSDIIAASNFSGLGTVAVGSTGGLGPYGTYDMAGNVAEWCINSAAGQRHRLGSSWQENSYQFQDVNAFDPAARGPGFGLRLARESDSIGPTHEDDIQIPPRPISEPVDDPTFAIYSRLYEYDPAPLEAVVDEADDGHEAWRRERVSFSAAYADERITAQVFIPRNSTPPYQTIVHFPGGDALLLGSSREAGLLHVEPFLRTGRAVVYPVYRGTFERRGRTTPGPNTRRDLIVDQVKDVRRTLDYLETRSDIDTDRIAFHGLSYGAVRAPFVLATEHRFRTAMLVSVGLVPSQHLPPEIQQIDYLPRVELPVLMVSGRDDFSFPYESAQLPFFDLIGTAAARKSHIALDSGHLPPGYTELTRALLDWTDEWLGPMPVR